ncbi:MAG: glycosyltransferase [Cyanobacteria bacterium P01_E01_bin.45]
MRTNYKNDRIRTLAFLFTTFLPEVSGSAIFNWERIKWLASKPRYKVVALVPNWQEKDSIRVPNELQESLIIEAYDSKPWPLYKLLRAPTLRAAKQINDSLCKFEPDILVVVDIERLFWFGTWNLTGRKYSLDLNIPYITEYHTDYYNHLSTYPGGKFLRDLILRPINRYLYQKCDTTLSISPAASRSLQEIGIQNYRELPMYGLDLSGFSPQKYDRQVLDCWLTESEKKNQVILFVGRIAHEKRIDILIEAFQDLLDKGFNYSLLIAGDGPKKVLKAIRLLADKTPNIHFVGFVYGEEKAKLIASCDVFCNPAPYETFGRTLVESMASGTPVVGVKSGGPADYLKDNINAYMAKPNDKDSLVNSLYLALSNKNTEIIENALKDSDVFTLENGCKALDKYYQEILWKSSRVAEDKSFVSSHYG